MADRPQRFTAAWKTLACMCTTSLATSPSSLNLEKPSTLSSVLLAHSRPFRFASERGRRAPPWPRAEQAPTAGHPRSPSVLLAAPPSCRSRPHLAQPVTSDRHARVEPAAIASKSSSAAAVLARPLSLLHPSRPHPRPPRSRAASCTPPFRSHSHRQPSPL